MKVAYNRSNVEVKRFKDRGAQCVTLLCKCEIYLQETQMELNAVYSRLDCIIGLLIAGSATMNSAAGETEDILRLFGDEQTL